MDRGQAKSAPIWHAWQANARAKPQRDAILYWNINGLVARVSWAQLYDDALRRAAMLRKAGVAAGDICATLIPNQPGFAALYMGIVLAGAVPAVLANPNPRLHPDKFLSGLRGMIEHSGFDWLLVERELDTVLEPLLAAAAGRFKGILYPLEADMGSLEAVPPTEAADVSVDAPCLLQHSSGTTGLQKPVVLSHRAVADHLDIYAKAIALTAEDRVVSWLPLYHDMGLITSFHLPLRFGLTLVQLDPIEWVKTPISLLEAASATGATLAWMPNFAYNLIGRRIDDKDRERLSLGSLRMLVNCSEPVREASHDVFATQLASAGLDANALGASYAMAETTFAVSQTPPGTRAKVIRAERSAFAQGRIVPAPGGVDSRSCTSSGRCIPGCTVEIRDEGGSVLGDNLVGEIFVESSSLFSGYRNRPEASAAVLDGRFYKTGDYGFLRDGELYVVGRKKDTIIVAGKNLSPEDIEDEISDIPGILPGRVVAIGVESESKGTDEIYVIAETAAETDAERQKLRIAAFKAGIAMDVTIRDIILVAPRALIKSSSGKPARAANRIHLPATVVSAGGA